MRLVPLSTLCLGGLALGACGTDTAAPPADAAPAAPTVVILTPAQHLTRASMALRGIRPSVADLQAVTADATALPGIVDRYLASPEFAETIKELHNETLLLRIEQPNFTYPAIGAIADRTFEEINHSVMDEPLQLIADIVTHDQPYTAIVTADYTMADATVATVWGLPHTLAPDQWEHSQYTDGRGSAGILTTSALFHRWRSTGFNYNRGRANMISRSLLCHDFLDSDIAVDTSVDLSNPDIVADAVVANKSCAGCHQTLDALASYLFTYKGNVNTGQLTEYPVPFYLSNGVNSWMRTNKRPPMYFGDAAPGLTGLGQAIAADPRFARCAAEHFASYFTEVAPAQLDGAWVAQLQAQFTAGGYNAKQLAKQVVLSDQFRVAYDTDATRAEGTVGELKARPEQLARMIADLTGFDWSTTSTGKVRNIPIGTANLWASDFIGFRVLAGGIDSYFVTEPVFTMNATSSLVAKSGAAAAASFVVDHDKVAAIGARTLFTAADVTATDEAHVRAQLAYLHARIYGELVDAASPEVSESYALYTGALAAAANDPVRAWKVTLVAMLSDFRSLFY